MELWEIHCLSLRDWKNSKPFFYMRKGVKDSPKFRATKPRVEGPHHPSA